jgi:hypothetical protein
MTLLNIHISPERVLVAVDTAGAFRGRPGGEVSKMAVLPHAGIVLAGRGNTSFMGSVWWYLQAVPGLHFDEAFAIHMPTALQHAQRQLDAMMVAESDEQRVYLIGPSRYGGRLAATEFVWRDRRLQLSHEVTGNIAPDIEGATADDDVSTDDLMLELARRQVAAYRDHPAFGGRLMVAEILAKPRLSISVRDVGDL